MKNINNLIDNYKVVSVIKNNKLFHYNYGKDAITKTITFGLILFLVFLFTGYIFNLFENLNYVFLSSNTVVLFSLLYFHYLQELKFEGQIKEKYEIMPGMIQRFLYLILRLFMLIEVLNFTLYYETANLLFLIIIALLSTLVITISVILDKSITNNIDFYILRKLSGYIVLDFILFLCFFNLTKISNPALVYLINGGLVLFFWVLIYFVSSLKLENRYRKIRRTLFVFASVTFTVSFFIISNILVVYIRGDHIASPTLRNRLVNSIEATIELPIPIDSFHQNYYQDENFKYVESYGYVEGSIHVLYVYGFNNELLNTIDLSENSYNNIIIIDGVLRFRFLEYWSTDRELYQYYKIDSFGNKIEDYYFIENQNVYEYNKHSYHFILNNKTYAIDVDNDLYEQTKDGYTKLPSDYFPNNEVIINSFDSVVFTYQDKIFQCDNTSIKYQCSNNYILHQDNLNQSELIITTVDDFLNNITVNDIFIDLKEFGFLGEFYKTEEEIIIFNKLGNDAIKVYDSEGELKYNTYLFNLKLDEDTAYERPLFVNNKFYIKSQKGLYLVTEEITKLEFIYLHSTGGNSYAEVDVTYHSLLAVIFIIGTLKLKGKEDNF